MVSIFFFNDTATTEIYTLSLHDALPICSSCTMNFLERRTRFLYIGWRTSASTETVTVLSALSATMSPTRSLRSEEHTSELQSRQYLVCRLLLEKKKKINTYPYIHLQFIY